MTKSIHDYRREVLDLITADARTIPCPDSPDFDIVTNVLWACLHPRYLTDLVEAIWTRTSLCVNDFGFRYPVPEVLDWDEEPWEGTQLLSVDRELYLPEAVFERLMCRVIRLFLERSPLHGAEAAQVEETLRKIEARCEQSAHPSS